MLNYMDILPVIRGTMSYVHVKHCIKIMSSAAGLAVGLAHQRAGVTSEYTGGTVVSEARELSLRESPELYTQLLAIQRPREFKNLGLENKTFGLRLEGKETTGVSSLSRVLMLLKTPPRPAE